MYLTPGESNHVFGYTNEELKEMIGLRLNRELFLCYFIIYHIITKFYTDSATYTYQEYVKVPEIVEAVDASFQGLAEKVETLALTEVEEYSFEQMALAWDLPLLTNEDSSVIRAEKGYPGRNGKEDISISDPSRIVSGSGGSILSDRPFFGADRELF